jgi:hypothetical protein
MPALSQASRHVSTHPAKANHSNLHIYFAKVALVEEPKNREGAVRYPQWNMQRYPLILLPPARKQRNQAF